MTIPAAGSRASLRGTDEAGRAALLGDGYCPDEIDAWARLGPLHDARRLLNAGFALEAARSMAWHEGLLSRLADSLVKTRRSGLRDEDLPWWDLGDVYLRRAPWVDQGRFAVWRRVALRAAGLHGAAVACGAGLSPGEADRLAREGRLDVEALAMMAALRREAGTPG